jgi:rod shape-determining protein MreC
MSVAGHNAPPIFKRGPAPLVRLFVLSAVALAMLVTDLRFRYLEVFRQALSMVTYPLQLAANTPADMAHNASTYFATLIQVQLENRELRRKQLEAAEQLLRSAHLEQENRELRGLLEMSRRVAVKSQAAEILYNARDPFSRKVILDKGSQQGIYAGLAVVDAGGVVGQVTRVYPIQAEVTLLTDKNQAIPVMVPRNGLRGVVFGAGQGVLELRFVEANADIQLGDQLVTSGLDGVFLPGLPVATVARIDRDVQAFARIFCRPAAGVERAGQVLVLGREALPPPVPEAPPAPVPKPGRRKLKD